MDARELTKYVYKIDNEVKDLKNEVEFLTNENKLLRRFIEDMQVDIKMLQRR